MHVRSQSLRRASVEDEALGSLFCGTCKCNHGSMGVGCACCRQSASTSVARLQNIDVDASVESAFDMPSISIESASLASLATLLLPLQNAWAGENAYGILAGRTASMLHPVTMLLLFATSLYSGYLGLQMRKLRGLSEEIKELQRQGPVLSTGLAKFPLSATIATVNSEIAQLQSSSDAADLQKVATLQKDLALLKSSLELDRQVAALAENRKRLQGEDLKGKHNYTGSILLGVGVMVSVLGGLNTYFRAGKLFPGPHLYAGAACTVLWALAAALVPSMQKGNEGARTAHIVLNTANVALFAWQVVTGLDIMFKVWEKTSW